MKKITCTKARKIDIVEYLTSIGHHPKKVRNQDYWYLSPLRNEKTASFKVNRNRQAWFDHGIGQGGDIIDFGVLYYKCSISDLLSLLSGTIFASMLPLSDKYEKVHINKSKIIIGNISQISSPSLLHYIESRCIPLEIATRFCKEVDFILYGKKQTAIGFQNDLGGYELRNKNFKGSSSPKTITFMIKNNEKELAVFEGYFNFLSFKTINKSLTAPLTNCLVLNSLSFFEKSRELMEKHQIIQLFLDRDDSGVRQTLRALEWNKTKYVDNCNFYWGHKDFNDWLMQNRQKSQLQKDNNSKNLLINYQTKHHG